MRNILKNIKDVVIDGFTNIFEYYKEHWIRFTLIGVTIIIFIILFINSTRQFVVFNDIIHIHNIYNDNCLIDQQLYIYGLSINIWLSFLTIISFIIGGLFALYQYDKSKKQRQQEKGSEISYKFSDKIAIKLSIINTILKDEKLIKKHILSLNPFSLNSFDYDELNNKLSNIKQIEKAYDDLINSKEIQEKYTLLYNTLLSEDDKQKFSPNFPLLIDTTLNELESICMDISSTVAGSQFIYPSLHQIFLDTIHILYLHIASANTTSKVFTDKYFTNVIFVYNQWNKIRAKDISKKEKVERNIDIINIQKEKKILKINKQIEKKINKAKKVIPKRV